MMRLQFSSFNPQPQPQPVRFGSVRFGSVRFGETFFRTDKNGKTVDNFGNIIRDGNDSQGSCGSGFSGGSYQDDEQDFINALRRLGPWGKQKLEELDKDKENIGK